MRRWFVAILAMLVLLSGCGRPAEPSIVLLDEPIEFCERSIGGRFVALGRLRFFDMQTQSVVLHSLPQTSVQYSSVWLIDELLFVSPLDPSGRPPMSNNNYTVSPGGFLLDVATGIVTDVTTLPQATQDQLLIDGSAAYRRDISMVQRSPDGQYWASFASITRIDPFINQPTDLIVASDIELVSECRRPWEPDSSGIIFLERISVSGWNLITEPGPLRFLPMP